ncbi:hypothetical protein D1007_60121 [Hordeum vulgare]|nr:hypothetical protein D1007_60121 [Hordeum vulgare]
MPSAATRSSSMGSSDIEFALDLEDIAARAAKADCIGTLACGRASFSYHRRPSASPSASLMIPSSVPNPAPFRLIPPNCLGDVQIARSAPVWELKAAIQGVFVALYHDMENAVTWQHLWSHFCLCFKDEKMTDDKESCVHLATSYSLRQSLLVICVPSARKRCMFLSSFAVNIFSARTVSLNDSVVGLTFSLEAFSGASTGPGNAGPVPCSSAVPCSPFLVQPTNMKLSIDSLKQTIVYIS